MIVRTINKIRKIYHDIKIEKDKLVYRPLYKLVEIQEEDNEFTVRIKVIQKNITFLVKPEDILADDNLVNQFSPKDVRALTYLGYLGINGPKYEILAKQLSQNDKITFLLKKNGNKNIVAKSATEIYNAVDIIKNMKSEDAQAVGYIAAMESIQLEQKQKSELVRNNEIKTME